MIWMRPKAVTVTVADTLGTLWTGHAAGRRHPVAWQEPDQEAQGQRVRDRSLAHGVRTRGGASHRYPLASFRPGLREGPRAGRELSGRVVRSSRVAMKDAQRVSLLGRTRCAIR